ncbi:MAG: histidine triad nucleotide-binding protein [Dehalococcoidia bacterium]|tara:strand:+ start:133 stop:477 length:345 start_codon:yes stop_codon:yes gene_type:complete
MTKTIFQKIIDRELPAEIVFEDKDIIAFWDINPAAPIHILIVPKKLITSINDIEEQDKVMIGRMFLVAKDLAKKYKIRENGFRTVFNTNDDGGQTVYHLHLHLLGGRKMSWPPG